MAFAIFSGYRDQVQSKRAREDLCKSRLAEVLAAKGSLDASKVRARVEEGRQACAVAGLKAQADTLQEAENYIDREVAAAEASATAASAASIAEALSKVSALVQNPNAVTPANVEKSKPTAAGGVAFDGHTTYSYDLPPLKDVTLTIRTDKNNWSFAFDAPSDFTPSAFGIPSTALCKSTAAYKFAGGPLAGSYMTVENKEGGSVYVHISSAKNLKQTQAIAGGKSDLPLDRTFCPADACGEPRTDMIVDCQDQVRSMLKAPTQAEFPGAWDGYGGRVVLEPKTCMSVFESYVDAPNSFGAKLRQQYRCAYDPQTKTIGVKFEN